MVPEPRSAEIWRIAGYDTFSGEDYDLEGEWPSEAEAVKAAISRLIELEQTQPTVSSGGQAYYGIQDRVYVVRPNGTRYRVMSIDSTGTEEIAEFREPHLWQCGCLRNSAGAHRVGCPDYPEGVRGWRG